MCFFIIWRLEYFGCICSNGVKILIFAKLHMLDDWRAKDIQTGINLKSSLGWNSCKNDIFTVSVHLWVFQYQPFQIHSAWFLIFLFSYAIARVLNIYSAEGWFFWGVQKFGTLGENVNTSISRYQPNEILQSFRVGSRKLWYSPICLCNSRSRFDVFLEIQAKVITSTARILVISGPNIWNTTFKSEI